MLRTVLVSKYTSVIVICIFLVFCIFFGIVWVWIYCFTSLEIFICFHFYVCEPHQSVPSTPLLTVLSLMVRLFVCLVAFFGNRTLNLRLSCKCSNILHCIIWSEVSQPTHVPRLRSLGFFVSLLLSNACTFLFIICFKRFFFISRDKSLSTRTYFYSFCVVQKACS